MHLFIEDGTCSTEIQSLFSTWIEFLSIQLHEHIEQVWIDATKIEI